jgi:methyltransferase-like protein 6
MLQVLRPGGKLLFRDYGVYDSAMIRFDPGHKLGDRFYVRQDGTRAYYFDKRVSVPISRTMGEAGFAVPTFRTTALGWCQRMN